MSDLTFKSEEERDLAIVALEKYDGEDVEEKLKSIEDAEIVDSAEQTTNSGDDNTVGVQPVEKPVINPVVEKPEQHDVAVQPVVKNDDVFTVKKADIPLGYKNIEDALAALVEKEDL